MYRNCTGPQCILGGPRHLLRGSMFTILKKASISEGAIQLAHIFVEFSAPVRRRFFWKKFIILGAELLPGKGESSLHKIYFITPKRGDHASNIL